MKKLIICRGIPGSGKSTWAKAQEGALVYSTDDYFMVDGEYKFVGKLLPAAHAWNLDRAKRAMLDDAELVIIDNTNTMTWHFQKYLDLAAEYGYEVEEKIFECDPDVAHARCSHGVPLDGIKRMAEQLENSLKS